MSENVSISPAQLLANQQNAQKSTGPATAQGKANARFNARRHGLTGQFYCMSESDEDAYKGFETNLLNDIKPVGPCETQLAIAIIQDRWRLNRSRSAEFNILGKSHDDFADNTIAPTANLQTASTQAQTFLAIHKALANIALYETRIHRMLTKNETRLEELQSRRKAAQAEAREEAELLVRYADSNNESPENVGLTLTNNGREVEFSLNGFVFSLCAIRANIYRSNQLAAARRDFSSGPRRRPKAA